MPLVRGEVDEDMHGYLEVSAIPLRRFLSASGTTLVVQHDWVQFSEMDLPEERMNVDFEEDWRRSVFHAINDQIDEHRSFSRLLGKHLVMSLDQNPCLEDDEHRGPFPEFIYAVDQTTGQPLRYTCDESQLSNNFSMIEGAPDYLTPVYFRREVLTKYAQQPEIYQVEKRMLRCLDLWHLSLDINPEGLVEVYLGDLGEYLPPEE